MHTKRMLRKKSVLYYGEYACTNKNRGSRRKMLLEGKKENR